MSFHGREAHQTGRYTVQSNCLESERNSGSAHRRGRPVTEVTYHMIPFKPHSGSDNVGNRWWLPGTGGWGVDVTVKRETETS